MTRRIAIIQGHPDPSAERFGRALAAAYARGAVSGGHETQIVEVATLDFSPLRTRREFEEGTPPDDIRRAQETLAWADHWAIFYPLWFGDAPALFKAFVEQAFRPGFALRYRPSGLPEGLLKGKSARLVVTMGMPAFVYQWFFFAHGLRNLKRNVLSYSGVSPIRATLIGSAKALDEATAQRWLARCEELGRQAN